MKKIFLLLIIFLFTANHFLFAQEKKDEKPTGTLIITVTGLRTAAGNVQIGLCNSEKSYDGEEKKFNGAIIKVEKKTVEWKIEDVPFGEYAVKVFHDENGNDELDTNFFGMPTESYGFSNNASGTFGPPSYEDAKFLFDKPEMTVEIKLN
jgi:uncharacterized protein (DUF2141 family)